MYFYHSYKFYNKDQMTNNAEHQREIQKANNRANRESKPLLVFHKDMQDANYYANVKK